MFSIKDLNILEEKCWQQLDGMNNQYPYINRESIVSFNHNDNEVVDPWLKEKYQLHTYPNHCDTRIATGNPYNYYKKKDLDSFFELMCRMHHIEYWSQRVTKDSVEEPKEWDKNKWLYANDMIGNDMFRYVLGERGQHPLVIIGINPSTAVPEKTDRTIDTVKRIIVESKKYDSYIMLNIYPQRATNPSNIHYNPVGDAVSENIRIIDNLLCDLANSNEVIDIWAAWGTNIELRGYLEDCLKAICEVSSKYLVHWIHKGISTHPFHPLAPHTTEFEDFDIERYVKNIF